LRVWNVPDVAVSLIATSRAVSAWNRYGRVVNPVPVLVPEIVSVNVLLSVKPAIVVAVNVSEPENDAVGNPVKKPVVVLNVIPAGSVPEIAQVIGPSPNAVKTST